jgi:hypothetical protein
MSGENDILKSPKLSKLGKPRKKTGKTGKTGKTDKTDKKRRDKSQPDNRRDSSTSIGKSAALVHNPSPIPSQESSITNCVTVGKPTDEALKAKLNQARKDTEEFMNATIKKLLDRVETLEHALARTDRQ